MAVAAQAAVARYRAPVATSVGRRSQSRCNTGAVADDWIEIGWVKSRHESTRHADSARLLDVWLAERHLSRTLITDHEIRIDLVHLGPGNGCDVRVLVNRAAIERASASGPPADALIQHLADLESPWDEHAGRSYDPVALVRYALTWPTDYWPGLALRWLEEGLSAGELLDDLDRFAAQAQRAQSQRHRAQAIRRAAGRSTI